MARISMIICDWCKNEFDEESVKDGIVLKRSDGKEKEFEICRECLKTIKARLEARSLNNVTFQRVYSRNSEEKLEDAIARIETNVEEMDEPGAPEVFAEGDIRIIEDEQPKKSKEQFEREFRAASKLKHGELKQIPSGWRAPTRQEIIEEERSRGCPHKFKSYDGGKVICVDAPPGYHGEGPRTGCGKVLQPDEV